MEVPDGQSLFAFGARQKQRMNDAEVSSVTPYVLALSIVLQFAAGILALRLIRLTGERVAWGFIAVAISLMAVRRCVSLSYILAGFPSGKPDMLAESIALGVSVMLLTGMARIAPLFSAIKRSEKSARQAARRMEESQRMYRTLAENLPGVVYRVHLRENCRMQFFNKVAESVIGYSEAELAKGGICSIEPLIAYQDYNEFESVVDRAVAERKHYCVEYRIRRKGGCIGWLMDEGAPVYNSAGQPLYIDGVFFDVTQQKKLSEALRESEATHRRIVETAAEGIWAVGVDGATTFVNARMAELLGYEDHEIIGKQLTAFMFEEDANDHRLKTENRRQGAAERYERRFRRKDGRIL